jgi:class 3 adenylate cyclase
VNFTVLGTLTCVSLHCHTLVAFDDKLAIAIRIATDLSTAMVNVDQGHLSLIMCRLGPVSGAFVSASTMSYHSRDPVGSTVNENSQLPAVDRKVILPGDGRY